MSLANSPEFHHRIPQAEIQQLWARFLDYGCPFPRRLRSRTAMKSSATRSACLAILTVILMGPSAAGQNGDAGVSGTQRRRGPDWVPVTKQAPWAARDSQAEFVHDGHLWILGGWVSASQPNLLDVWKSPDGKNWTRTLDAGPWVQTDLPVSLVFQDQMWLMGGRKVPGTECSSKVWSSTNGADWALVTAAAGWSARLAPAFAVFKERMWILGGTTDFYQNNERTLLNDVWSSADGKNWHLETADAGWSKRANGSAVAFDGKLWVMGGGARNPRALPTNDIWSSPDGVHWTQVTSSAPWKPRLWFSTVVYRDRMWVIGGWSEEERNFGDVWYSPDGKNWTELTADVIWSKRHEHSAFVFQDKIWIAGGAAGEDYTLDSEVWTLELPRDWDGGESEGTTFD